MADLFNSLLPSLPHSSDTNLFLIHHPNGVIPTTAQDAPLALITRPRSQSSTPSNKPVPSAVSPTYPVPINLKKHSKKMSYSFVSLLQSSASSDVTVKRRKTPVSVCSGKRLSKSNLAGLLGASTTSSKSEVCSWRDSDDTSGEDHEDDDDDNDDHEDEDSGSSLSGENKMALISFMHTCKLGVQPKPERMTFPAGISQHFKDQNMQSKKESRQMGKKK